LGGCPKVVGNSFSCGGNSLTSLEGCPKVVGGSFYCGNNQLTSLDGCPNVLGDGDNSKYKDFVCSSNKLTSLVGCPTSGGNFYCGQNNLVDESYYHLFDLGYDSDNVLTDTDLVGLRRQWVINGIINE
jgi:hypothetical protein